MDHKYKSKLHALIARGPLPSRKAWKDNILGYVTHNCDISKNPDRTGHANYASPLPSNLVPTDDLNDDLRTEENGFIPLSLAVEMNCPSEVIAALCYLFPKGATVPIADGSLPLHVAATRPTGSDNKKKPNHLVSDNLTVIGILIEAYPNALITRDNQGRTPLIRLFQNHASTRHVELIEKMSKVVDSEVWRTEVEARNYNTFEKVPLPVPSSISKARNSDHFIPASALAIPDYIHGALPIHYAAKNGASKEVVSVLIKGYLASVGFRDSRGRIPLHWYLGAADGTVSIGYEHEKIPMHHSPRSSNIISLLTERATLGDIAPLRMKDLHPSGRDHRCAIHYAIELLSKNICDPPLVQNGEEFPRSCLTIKALQMIIDGYKKGLLDMDALGCTPLHILFRSSISINDIMYKTALENARSGASNIEGSDTPKVFSPPMNLLEILLEESLVKDVQASASMLTDVRGLLPLHLAVLSNASITILQTLLKSYPESLAQLTEMTTSVDASYVDEYYNFSSDDPLYVSPFKDFRTPLHFLFANPFIARSVSVEKIQSLVSSQLDLRDGKMIQLDGRKALNMQDANGDTPLHLAAKNVASFEALSFLLKYDSSVAKIPNKNGDLPLHLLINQHFAFVNADIAIAHSAKVDFESPELSQAFKNKVRDLAKQQAFISRLFKMNMCGAIFAPTNGWVSEKDEVKEIHVDNIMKKIHLLAMTLVDDASKLRIRGSVYGLNCLQILIGFDAAPYSTIQQIMDLVPDTALAVSNVNESTVLDLHHLRKMIPSEVSKIEMDSWKAIKELIVSYILCPIDDVYSCKLPIIHQARRDKDLINSLEQQIIAEITGDTTLSYHWKGNHPVNPRHIRIGIRDCYSTTGDDLKITSESALSDACARAWIFFVAYINPNDESDNYANSVDKILDKLTHVETMTLVRMSIPNGAIKANWEGSMLTVDMYASISCKFLLHKYSYFAGAYDLSPKTESSILVHRGVEGNSVFIRATHMEIFRTKNADGSFKKRDPRQDVRKRDDFYLKQRPVILKLIRDSFTFEKEIRWRDELSSFDHSNAVVPILDTFDPEVIERSQDKKYQTDRYDRRFTKIPLRNNSLTEESDEEEYLDMTLYPYAIVFPYATEGSLLDTIVKGNLDITNAKRSLRHIAELLDGLHSHGLIHGSISIRNMLTFYETTDQGKISQFKLTGLTTITPVDDISAKLGAITPKGECLFDSSTLPPEMFVKLDSVQLAFYNEYWRVVRAMEGVNVPDDIIKARVDPLSGDKYVIKCFCALDEEVQKSLPILPYQLEEYSKDIDIWAFGLVLFTIMSNGEIALKPNFRTGRMSSYEVIANWNTESADSMITQYVKDVGAQDLLSHILLPKEDRSLLDMHTILSHPFFSSGEISKDIELLLLDARDERELIGEMRKKAIEREKNEDRFRTQTTHIGRLQIQTQIRLTNSITEVLKEAFDPTKTFTNTSPYSLIITPYKFAKSKDGKLTPSSKADIQLAERIGLQLLELGKAVYLAVSYVDMLQDKDPDLEELYLNALLNPECSIAVAAHEMLGCLGLDKEHFADFASSFVGLVRKKLETDPMNLTKNPSSVVLDFLSSYIDRITGTFSEHNKAYLYLVDEYSCTPSVKKGKVQYPHLFSSHIYDIVCKSIPYMHACMNSALGSGEGLLGLVKLIFEAAYPNVPPSWEEAAKGLPTVPRRRRMVMDVKLLHQVVHTMIPNDSPVALNGEPELNFFNCLFIHIDSERHFGGLSPITDSFSTMWVGPDSKELIVHESELESRPERVIQLFVNRDAEEDIVHEKNERIRELEKDLLRVTREAEKLRIG